MRSASVAVTVMSGVPTSWAEEKVAEYGSLMKTGGLLLRRMLMVTCTGRLLRGLGAPSRATTVSCKIPWVDEQLSW